MNDMFIGWAINTLIMFLEYGVKNQASKKKFEKAMYKVWSIIGMVYPNFKDGPPALPRKRK